MPPGRGQRGIESGTIRPRYNRRVARVLFCAPEFPPAPGGAPTLFASLAKRWRESGGESVVYTAAPAGMPAGEEHPGGLRVRRFRRLSARWPRLRAQVLGPASRLGPVRWRAAIGFPYLLTSGYRSFLRNGALTEDGPIDLVVCGVLPHTHFMEPALRFARRHGLPCLAIPLLHTGLLGSHPARHVLGCGARTLLRAVDRVAVMTKAEVEPLVRLGVEQSRIAILSAALDTAEPRGDGRAFAMRHGLDGRWVVQAGGLSADKGTLDLMDAHLARAQRGATEALVLIGRPEPEVRHAVDGLHRQRRGGTVTLLETPADADWDGALAGAAALIHPSRAESFGLVILESWRAGVPVVVADAGGLSYLVRHGEDGLLVPPGDPAALGAAMDQLLGDPLLARRLGGAGRARLQQTLTWKQAYPPWGRLFREMLER